MIDRLSPSELSALTRFRDETFPDDTLEDVAVYLLRDHLIGLGLLELEKGSPHPSPIAYGE